MTAHEYDLAVRAVIGLAGCAVALVAITLDWREQLRFESWRDVALGAIAEGEAVPRLAIARHHLDDQRQRTDASLMLRFVVWWRTRVGEQAVVWARAVAWLH